MLRTALKFLTLRLAWRRDRRLSPMPPLLLLTFATLLVIGSMLVAATGQNRAESARSRERIERGLEAMGETLAATLYDYAVWDEAVAHLVDGLDIEWADKNIGAWLAENSHVQHTFVVRPDGSLPYAVQHGRHRTDLIFGDDIKAIIEQARAIAGKGPKVRATGFARIGGQRLLVAAAAIMGEDAEAPPTAPTVLVITWDLGSYVVPKVAERAGIEALQVNGDGRQQWVLPDPLGRELATLSWTPAAPGSEFVNRALPGMALAFAIITALSVGLWVRLRDAFRDLADALRKARRAEHRQRLFLSASPDHWLRIDGQGVILDTYGPSDGPLSRQLAQAQHLSDIFPPDVFDSLRTLASAIVDTGERAACDLHLPDQGLWLEARLVRLNEDEIAVTLGDISFRKWAEEKLEREAHFDGLTGLPNRTLTLDRLARALAAAQRNGTQVGVMLLDLNDFKAVNDTLGHPAGDALLIEVGRRLSAAVRRCDTVGRMGGDEFLLVFPDLLYSEAVDTIAAKVLAHLCLPAEIAGQELRVSGVIGVSVYPDDGAAAEELIKNADTALYRAKRDGHERYLRFRPDMRQQLEFRLMVERRLTRAFQAGEVFLCYQPLYDLATNRIVAAEALVRWQPDDIPNMRPDVFIPIAESCGLIAEMGRWILHTACATAARWRRDFEADLTMAVNMSPRQFRGRVIDDVRDALASSGLPANRLEIEITEGLLLEDDNIDQLMELRALGVHLSIDDFGTGFSSLGYLRRIPFHTLKIDRSFIQEVLNRPADAMLARNILRMAADLGLRTVGEGVETAEQMEFLREWGCTCIQGYLISPPIRAKRFAELLLPERREAADEARSA